VNVEPVAGIGIGLPHFYHNPGSPSLLNRS
jgi:hypothetical protein